MKRVVNERSFMLIKSVLINIKFNVALGIKDGLPSYIRVSEKTLVSIFDLPTLLAVTFTSSNIPQFCHHSL